MKRVPLARIIASYNKARAHLPGNIMNAMASYLSNDRTSSKREKRCVIGVLSLSVSTPEC